MDDRILGPVHGGYYLAAYACPTQGGSFVGYYKILSTPVAGYFDDGICVTKGCVDVACEAEDDAVALALRFARHRVRKLAPADQLPFVQQRRRPWNWELRGLRVRRRAHA